VIKVTLGIWYEAAGKLHILNKGEPYIPGFRPEIQIRRKEFGAGYRLKNRGVNDHGRILLRQAHDLREFTE
jgi:hypothetical protein